MNDDMRLSLERRLEAMEPIPGNTVASPAREYTPMEQLHAINEKLAANPTDAVAYYERGALMFSLGNVVEALGNLHLAALYDKSNLGPYVTRAAVLIHCGFLIDAIQDCDLVLEKVPNQIDALLNKSAAMILGKDYLPALDVLDKIIELQPATNALNNRAACYHGLGRHLEAVREYRRILELEPHLHHVHSSLIACLDFAHAEGFDIFQDERRNYYKTHCLNLPRLTPERPKDPERKITVGYVSADFRYHATAFLMRTFLTRHDRSRFRVILYSNTHQQEE